MERKAGRNTRIVYDALNGKTFKTIGQELRLHQVSIRMAFLRKIKSLSKDLWEEGRKVSAYGTYAAPSIHWLRENKERFFSIMEQTAQSKKQHDEISTRDYLAGQALAGLLMATSNLRPPAQHTAFRAYEIADAMLEERQRKRGSE